MSEFAWQKLWMCEVSSWFEERVHQRCLAKQFQKADQLSAENDQLLHGEWRRTHADFALLRRISLPNTKPTSQMATSHWYHKLTSQTQGLLDFHHMDSAHAWGLDVSQPIDMSFRIGEMGNMPAITQNM